MVEGISFLLKFIVYETGSAVVNNKKTYEKEIAAQIFEAEDFLNIFSRLFGFWGSFLRTHFLIKNV